MRGGLPSLIRVPIERTTFNLATIALIIITGMCGDMAVRAVVAPLHLRWPLGSVDRMMTTVTWIGLIVFLLTPVCFAVVNSLRSQRIQAREILRVRPGFAITGASLTLYPLIVGSGFGAWFRRAAGSAVVTVPSVTLNVGVAIVSGVIVCAIARDVLRSLNGHDLPRLSHSRWSRAMSSIRRFQLQIGRFGERYAKPPAQQPQAALERGCSPDAAVVDEGVGTSVPCTALVPDRVQPQTLAGERTSSDDDHPDGGLDEPLRVPPEWFKDR